ncbi:MAG: hypothetical protein ACR2N1_10090 [Rubripirellula sp.]
MKPTEEYLEAAETSAKQDWRNMIILRTAIGFLFAMDVFAIWKVAGTEGDHGGQPSVSVSRPVAKLLLGMLKYLGSYTLGILVAVPLTGLAENLKGFDEVASLMFWSILGLYFFFTFLISEFADLVFYAWWALLILLIPFVCEAFAFFRRRSSVRSWRPLWIGFPVGFLGTTGVCWQALRSL